MRLYVTKGDATQAPAGIAAFKDYIAIETDPAKKLKAQLDLADMLLTTGASDQALAAYQEILATSPDNADALFGAGMALYGQQDKARYQEAANYLQKYVDKAPAGHQYKDEAKQILDFMKENENVTPDKKGATPKKPRP
jgi:tetratricopeptide (TPR) repeat protein